MNVGNIDNLELHDQDIKKFNAEPIGFPPKTIVNKDFDHPVDNPDAIDSNGFKGSLSDRPVLQRVVGIYFIDFRCHLVMIAT
jgi:hypothetical protein